MEKTSDIYKPIFNETLRSVSMPENSVGKALGYLKESPLIHHC
jgi:hypothetical protein